MICWILLGRSKLVHEFAAPAEKEGLVALGVFAVTSIKVHHRDLGLSRRYVANNNVFSLLYACVVILCKTSYDGEQKEVGMDAKDDLTQACAEFDE